MKFRKKLSKKLSGKKWRKGLKVRKRNSNSTTTPRGGIRL